MKGTRYNSEIDWLAWTVIIFTALICSIPIFLGLMALGVVLIVFFVLLELVAFYGTYYEICEDELIIRSFYRKEIYPIDEIKEIKPTDSWLAAAASSLTKRIAITFNRGIKRGSLPLIISPRNQIEFIRQLQSINGNIEA